MTESITSLSEDIRSSRFPVFVCGAGLSHGVAPLAQDVEDGLLSAVVALAGAETGSEIALAAGQEVRQEYLTLELLVSFIRYRAPKLAPPLRALYTDLFRLTQPSRTHRALAQAFTAGWPKAILTSNFDDGLYKAIGELRFPLSLVTEANAKHRVPKPGDICAFHGTVFEGHVSERPSGPSSMTARELAHPFVPDLATYLTRVIDEADRVYFVGYRGEDHYDLNLLLHWYLASGPPEMLSGRRAKFRVVPHGGDIQEVPERFQGWFGTNAVVLTDGTPQWLPTVSGKAGHRRPTN